MALAPSLICLKKIGFVLHECFYTFMFGKRALRQLSGFYDLANSRISPRTRVRCCSREKLDACCFRGGADRKVGAELA